MTACAQYTSLSTDDPNGRCGEVDLGHVVGDELGAEALGLAAEVLHHLRPHHPVRVAGVVLDVARDHQLAAPLEPLDHERLELGPRRIERGRVAGGAAADDDQFAYVVADAQLVLLKRMSLY